MAIEREDPQVPALKDKESERPIPTVWRPVISKIVRAFVSSDYQLSAGVPGVAPVSPETAEQIRTHIQDYGTELIELPEETWGSSVCIWMGDRWDALIDLWTLSEGRSDLVLSLQVSEHESGFEFNVYMVYVPQGASPHNHFYRWEAGGCCSIGNVIVSPAARGRGVGCYLVEQMIDLAFSKHQAADGPAEYQFIRADAASRRGLVPALGLMRVEPYKRVDTIEFGASRDSVIASLGEPMREGRTRKGMVELEYPSGFYRFSANGLLAEISVDAPVVELDAMSVPFENLDAFLGNHDHEAFEAVGFIVSPKYGIAFDPCDAAWVTAFPQESLSLWRSFTTR